MNGLKRSSHPLDKRGLIGEAFNMEGVSEAQCRSIFFDWALGLPDNEDMPACAAKLHALHSAEFPDHPMTKVLLEARGSAETAGRRRRRFSDRRKTT